MIPRIHGKQFDPATSLRALCSYRDRDLPELSEEIRHRLIEAAAQVEQIPIIQTHHDTIT